MSSLNLTDPIHSKQEPQISSIPSAEERLQLRALEEREKYELEMALAISLSEYDSKTNEKDTNKGQIIQ